MSEQNTAYRILQEPLSQVMKVRGWQYIFIEWRTVYKTEPTKLPSPQPLTFPSPYFEPEGKGTFVDEFKLIGPDGSSVPIKPEVFVSLLNHFGQRGWEIFHIEVKNAVYRMQQEGGSEAPTNVPVWKRWWLKRPTQ